MLITKKLLNISFTSHNYYFVVVVMVRILKLHTHSKFQIYDIVLLAIVTTLYITSPELNYLVTECLYPLTSLSPFPSPLSP